MFCTCAKHLRRDIDLLCTLCALNSMVTSVVVMKHFSTHLFTSVSASIESIEGKANIRRYRREKLVYIVLRPQLCCYSGLKY
jgi:hypothetical protein